MSATLKDSDCLLSFIAVNVNLTVTSCRSKSTSRGSDLAGERPPTWILLMLKKLILFYYQNSMWWPVYSTPLIKRSHIFSALMIKKTNSTWKSGDINRQRSKHSVFELCLGDLKSPEKMFFLLSVAVFTACFSFLVCLCKSKMNS